MFFIKAVMKISSYHDEPQLKFQDIFIFRKNKFNFLSILYFCALLSQGPSRDTVSVGFFKYTQYSFYV
jgi:hypothetical protein